LAIDKQIAPDLSELVMHLARPQAFPFPLTLSEQIVVLQTHASVVFLAGQRAYKIKKARNSGFFDYTTPALRRQFCEQEILLNARLAPRVYQGVAPVLANAVGKLRFGSVCVPGHVPEPGTQQEGEEVIDYAVVMQRLPEEATLAALVASGRATPELLRAVAERIAHFHQAAASNRSFADFGSLRVIRHNWDENFAQIYPYLGRSLEPLTYNQLSTYIYAFLDGYASLFQARQRQGHIRDCHGDLRLQHVYVLSPDLHMAQPGEAEPLICVVDCIEFNERFRYSDVASEVAFLAMELAAAGRADLARTFVDAYTVQTGDHALIELLPFYACYRACVRGKVLSMQLDQPEVPEQQRQAVQHEASALFRLAATYASGPTRPTLLLVGGLMGTGKSTLARQLHDELGWSLFSADVLRKHLAGLAFVQPQAHQTHQAHQTQPDAFGEGLYSPAWTARTYQEMFELALARLKTGHSVILDATFGLRWHRHAAAQTAALSGANLVFLECQAPRSQVLQRLATRWQARQNEPGGHLRIASEGRPDLYDAQAASWQPFRAEEEPVGEYLLVDTAHLPCNLTPLLDTLSIPRLLRHVQACDPGVW
jgi:aminoglycoside phosphotransferase family enzyme/predicted kinase